MLTSLPESNPACRASRHTLLLMGSNLTGPWGAPAATLRRAIVELQRGGITVVAQSAVYKTPPLGPHQPAYLNQALLIVSPIAPAALLRRLKQWERAAGRRMRGRWMARTLDLDIISSRGVRSGWPHRQPGTLSLPHPEAHRRAFVLVPLLSVAPHWQHTALRRPGAHLLSRLSARDRRGVRALPMADLMV